MSDPSWKLMEKFLPELLEGKIPHNFEHVLMQRVTRTIFAPGDGRGHGDARTILDALRQILATMPEEGRNIVRAPDEASMEVRSAYLIGVLNFAQMLVSDIAIRHDNTVQFEAAMTNPIFAGMLGRLDTAELRVSSPDGISVVERHILHQMMEAGLAYSVREEAIQVFSLTPHAKDYLAYQASSTPTA